MVVLRPKHYRQLIHCQVNYHRSSTKDCWVLLEAYAVLDWQRQLLVLLNQTQCLNSSFLLWPTDLEESPLNALWSALSCLGRDRIKKVFQLFLNDLKGDFRRKHLIRKPIRLYYLLVDLILWWNLGFSGCPLQNKVQRRRSTEGKNVPILTFITHNILPLFL